MKRVLVTGGAGFIGSNFVRHLLRAIPDVTIINLDALTYAGSPENLRDLPGESRHTFILGDICNTSLVESLLHDQQIDTVVHFAAESHVDRSILGPSPFMKTNIIGTFTLLEAVRQAWGYDGGKPKRLTGETKRFHHVSTDEVFGSLATDDPAFTETTPYDPRSPYSASKAASDHLVRAYFHTYGLPVTITNCSNNYGPYQFPEKLIPLMILNGVQRKPLPIYGDGKQIRDWLYVLDHCDAIQLVLEQGQPGETYNIGGGNQPYNIDLVEELCTLLDELHPKSGPHAQLITHIPDRPGHDRRYAMDTTKIRNELGWKPRHDLKSGLSETVQWYLKNTAWVKAILAQDNYQNWLDKNYMERGEQ